jgi:quercetin dioxygenase-like cupin family protein
MSEHNAPNPFSTRRSDPGVVAGPEHGLRRLIIRVQPVAPDDIGWLHRHDGDQLLCVLAGEVLIEVDGERRICREGELGIAPAGAAHGFLGLGAPATLEVFGEQGCGTELLLRDGGTVELHRPGVPWDRPGPATDMAALTPRALAPQSIE